MISIDLYKIIADLINDAQVRGGDIVSNINQMATDLSNSEISSEDNERLRLESQITATSNLVELRHNVYTAQLLNFVFELQTYVDNNYSSVNNFLSDNNTKVKPIFADASKEVGFLIDPANIEGSPSI